MQEAIAALEARLLGRVIDRSRPPVAS
jgi:hypothetical protein